MTTTYHTWISLCCSILFYFLPCHLHASQMDVQALILQCKSKNATIVYAAVKSLQKAPLSDFQSNDKVLLAELLNTEQLHLDKIIKLAGFVGLQQELISLSKQKISNKNTEQALNLALVRTGDQQRLNIMLKNLQNVKLNDDFVHDLLPVLVYVRNKEIMDFVLEKILSDEYNCYPADAEIDGNILCAYGIIEQIAPFIKDFPVKINRYGIDTDNYQMMLNEVRGWILENENYSLISNKY